MSGWSVLWNATNLYFVLCSLCFVLSFFLLLPFVFLCCVSCMTMVLNSQNVGIWPAWTSESISLSMIPNNFLPNVIPWFWWFFPLVRLFFGGMNLLYLSFAPLPPHTVWPSLPLITFHSVVVAPPSLPCSPPPSCLDPSHLSQASPLHHRHGDGGMHSQGETLFFYLLVNSHTSKLKGEICYTLSRICFLLAEKKI